MKKFWKKHIHSNEKPQIGEAEAVVEIATEEQPATADSSKMETGIATEGKEATNAQEEPPINLIEMAKKIWAAKWQYIFILPVVLVCTYLLTLSVPRYYTCNLVLAPEGNGNGTASSISSLASSFGLDGLGNLSGSDDAISPLLYPDLLKSPNFIVRLFPIHVETKKDSISTNYYDYMKKYQKSPFWNKYIFDPIKKAFKKPVKETPFVGTEEVDVRHLDSSQQDVLNSIIGNITCSIDKKTDAISIIVKDQDPEVCATIGDSILSHMQAFIIDYRTKKARNDYAYFKKLRDEAKQRYEKIRRAYAEKADANTDVTLETINTELTDMENEMQLRFNTYNALATQAQSYQAKIQENTPAFTAITTAMAPAKPAGPKRLMISIMVTLLAAFILTVRVLVKK